MAVAFTWGGAVRAHEIGTTRVSVLFQEHRSYEIEIQTDASALVEKLEASAGRSWSPETSPARLQALLQGFDETFRRRLTVAFDASEAHPTIAYTVVPAADASSSPVATIRLTGELPPEARAFTWAYAWTFASYAITVRNAAVEQPTSQWLEGGQTSTAYTLPPPAAPVDRFGAAWRCLRLGFARVVPHGLDQMLFVLGLYLLSRRARSLAWQVGSFGAAHSIALALGMYGVVAAPPGIIGALIALSVVYVAVDNIVRSELESWRLVFVFACGIVHGMESAEALQAFGLARSAFPTAILTFNAGVEAGHLAVIGAAIVLVGRQCADCAWYRSRIVLPASALVACAAVYWTIERLPF